MAGSSTTLSGLSIASLVTDAQEPLKPNQILAEVSKIEALRKLVSFYGHELKANHQYVLTEVMGLATDEPRSQSDVAAELELSRERIGAICRQALKRLVKLALKGGASTSEDLSSSTGIVKHGGADELARAISWANLSDEDLRREAMTAANARDADSLWHLTEAYLSLYSAKMSRHTLKNYRRGLIDLLELWTDENLLRPSRDAGAKYRTRLKTRVYALSKAGKPLHYKPATINLKIAAARALYRALRWAGATTSHPFDDVKPVPDNEALEEKRSAYSVLEVRKLLAAADAVGGSYSGIDRTFVLLCAHGGLRVEEATTLTWGAIDFREGGIRVTGKGDKTEWVALTPELQVALETLRQNQPADEQILPFGSGRARERLANLCARAGVVYTGKAVHGLRHYAGTRLYNLYNSIDVPADHLRHASVQTTRRYAKKSKLKKRELVQNMGGDSNETNSEVESE